MSTRVSLKQALADQGITGEGRSLTERDLWVQKEKEALAEIMLEHGIEWEQKGEQKEHLSVLEFKREKRKEELAELEQSIERVQKQQVSIQAVEQVEAKPLPLSSKVAVGKEDFQNLVTAAQKFVAQEKQEGKLKKLLKDAKKTIADLKAKIESLVTELSAVKAELAQYKSVCGKLRTADLEQENDRLRSRLRTYEEVISCNNLWLISLEAEQEYRQGKKSNDSHIKLKFEEDSPNEKFTLCVQHGYRLRGTENDRWHDDLHRLYRRGKRGCRQYVSAVRAGLSDL